MTQGRAESYSYDRSSPGYRIRILRTHEIRTVIQSRNILQLLHGLDNHVKMFGTHSMRYPHPRLQGFECWLFQVNPVLVISFGVLIDLHF